MEQRLRVSPLQTSRPARRGRVPGRGVQRSEPAEGRVFVRMLNEAWESRRRKNRQYSRRAFARDLGISPSHLLRLDQGQSKLSLPLARRMASALGWVGPKSNRFLTSVAEQDDRDALEAQRALQKSRAISSEEFQRICEWHYLAVLELCELQEFVVSPASVSAALEIPLSKSTQALETLLELGLIEKTAGRGYRKLQAWVQTSGRDKTSLGHRLHQKSLLLKAARNVDRVPLEQRANFGSMYAIDPDQIPEAKELISQFILDLEKLLAGKKRSRVYAAGIFLTPLSHLVQSKG